MATKADTETPSPAPTSLLRESFSLIAAAIFLIAYLLLSSLLLFRWIDAQEQLWSRSLLLYHGIEAIAFTAAGYLFGREVNRARAENAEQRAEKVQQQATQAEKEAVQEATKGKALAAAVETLPSAGSLQEYGALGPGAAAVQSGVDQVKQLAKQLYR